MLKLPPAVVDYILSGIIENRSPAYLRVGKDGILREFGGNLVIYGLENLRKGEPISGQVYFLEGLLPLSGPFLVVPCMQTARGPAADLHIFPGDQEDWVLLVDASADEVQRRLIQQKGNELVLLSRKQAKMLEQFLGKEVSEQVAQGILPLRASGERKEVTILVAGFRGLDFHAGSLPADNIFSVLNSYLPAVVQPLLEEAGIVEKLLGEKVVAVFGLLPSDRSLPYLAIRSALRIVQGMGQCAEAAGASELPRLGVGIGIASGPVAVGILGSEQRRSFSLLGPAVGMATRLEREARPNQIIVDQNSFAGMGAVPEDFSPLTLPGEDHDSPVRAFSYTVG